MNWPVYKVYSDPGFTGSNINRPALQAMIKDIRNGHIDRVVVYKLDRLSRNQKDILTLIEDEFLKNDCDFVSMNENFDTSTPFGRAMIGILAVFAQLEREQIKERMMMGKEARAKEGRWAGGVIPIGYDYVDGILKINEFEAMQVKEAYQLASENHSPIKIAKMLNAKGYKTKYGKWQSKSVSRILRSKDYIGQIMFYGEWMPGIHKPIITQEQYDAVQNLMDARSEYYLTNRLHGRINSYLGGLLCCCNCGGKYSRIHSTTKKRCGEGYYDYYFYSCNSRSKRNKNLVIDENCKNKIWKMDELDNLIFAEIKKLALDPMHIQGTMEAPDDKTPVIMGEIDNIGHKISKLMDLYLMDGISKDSLTEKINGLSEQKIKLEQELEDIRKKQSTKPTKNQIMVAATSFSDVLEHGSFQEIRNIITQLIHHIDIDGEDITIHWNF